ncbi:hypothetical protein [Litorivivens sp.]|uniref:hypothetical protein n=1 Tax=Litorivivens sp. TaxID=2020868 RepID=UPI0035645DD4
MLSLFHPRIIARVVTLVLALLPCLSYAASPQDRVGVLVELNWQLGDIRPDQNRWQANFALGQTGDIVRAVHETASLTASKYDPFEFEYVAGYYQEHSLRPLQWSTDSLGNSLGRLYGVSVVSKISPVFNASETSTGSSATLASNPWVWIGAVVVGVAATAGGGGGGGGGGGSSNSSGTNNNGTLVGGDECDVVSGSATAPQVVSGCQVAGNEVNAP